MGQGQQAGCRGGAGHGVLQQAAVAAGAAAAAAAAGGAAAAAAVAAAPLTAMGGHDPLYLQPPPALLHLGSQLLLPLLRQVPQALPLLQQAQRVHGALQPARAAGKDGKRRGGGGGLLQAAKA